MNDLHTTKTILKGGTVVTPREAVAADISFENGKITAIGAGLPTDCAEIIGASGCTIFPGFIDAHTHLDMDTGVTHTADDFETGTRAAVSGGTTTIVDFATQQKGESLADALNQWHKKAEGKCYCDYGFHMAITDWNASVAREVAEMARCGVTSFKLYLAYDALRVTDGELYDVLKAVKAIKGIVGVHCENGDVIKKLVNEHVNAGKTAPKYHAMSRPDYTEAEAISRVCRIAQAAIAPVHIVHLSTEAGLDEAVRARKRGQRVFIETCPQYLVLDESRLDADGFEGAKFVCSPPLRKQSDVAALWAAVSDGAIDTISTDHCSFNFKGQKDIGLNDFSKIPNGLPGIEHRAALMFTHGVCEGRISLVRFAELVSSNAARLFGMYPRKGALAVGSDADIVIWDPNWCETITAGTMTQNVDYTPYEGMAVRGRAKMVFLRGALVKGGVNNECIGTYIARHTLDGE